MPYTEMESETKPDNTGHESGQKESSDPARVAPTYPRKMKVKFTEDLRLKLAENAGQFLILPLMIEYINLSDFIPINIGFLRRQGNNEDRLSAPFQY